MPSRALSRRDPLSSDVYDFRRRLDEVFPRMFSLPLWDRWNATSDLAWIPPLDCYIDQNRFHVHMALPGVRPEDVNLQVHGNELSISGERKQDATPSEDRTFQREITYGAFERTTTLPEGVQSDKLEANFRNGVLEISAPMSEKAMPRKIEIKGEGGVSGKKLAA